VERVAGWRCFRRSAAASVVWAEASVAGAADPVVSDRSRNLAHICPNPSSHTLLNRADFSYMQLLLVLRRSWPEGLLPPTISIPTPSRRYAELSLNAPLGTQKLMRRSNCAPPGTHVPSVNVRKFVREVTKADRCWEPNKAQPKSEDFRPFTAPALDDRKLDEALFPRRVSLFRRSRMLRAGLVPSSRGCHA
jgi:hypothetical protein